MLIRKEGYTISVYVHSNRVTPESVSAGTQQDVFSAAQKDLSSPKSLAVHADNLTSKVGRLKFQGKDWQS